MAATVVMGWDYDVDVAMSGSCIYCCAYTSEVLCTLLVSHLYRFFILMYSCCFSKLGALSL